MAAKEPKLTEVPKADADVLGADKENEPVQPSDGAKKRDEREDGEKKRDEREEGKTSNEGDDFKLVIGEQYMVRRGDDTWRKDDAIIKPHLY